MAYEENGFPEDGDESEDEASDRPEPAAPDAATLDAIGIRNPGYMELEADELDTMVLVRRASAEDVRAFKLRIVSNEREKQITAHAQLFWGCLLWPKAEAAREAFKALPLAPDQFGKYIIDKAGDTMKVRQKKRRRD